MTDETCDIQSVHSSFKSDRGIINERMVLCIKHERLALMILRMGLQILEPTIPRMQHKSILGAIFSAEQHYLWRLRHYVNEFGPRSTLLNLAFVQNVYWYTQRGDSLPARIPEHLIPTHARWCHIPTPGKIQKTSSQTTARCLRHRSLKYMKKLLSLWPRLLSSGHHTAQGASFIPITKRKACWHLLRTLLAAATRSYVLASSYMILTRNWPSISSWASLLKTKWGHHSCATASLTARGFVEHAPSFCCCFWC